MSYSKRNWTDKTPISVDNLNAMDDGIYQNSTDISEMKESLAPSIGTLTKAPTNTTVGRKKQLAVTPNSSGDGYDLYICSGQNDDNTYNWVQVAKDVVDLSSLGVYPLVYRSSSVTPASENVGQLEYVGSALGGNQGLYVLLYKNENNERRVKLVTSDDLSSYVPATRSIAGLGLSGDISVADLQDALNTYPIITLSGEPTEQTEGKCGQLGVYITYDGSKYTFSFYYCWKSNGNGYYGWTKINDYSSCVPTSRLVAGLNLTSDITADELNDALGIVSKAGENIFEYSEDNLLVGYTTTSASIADILDTLELTADNTTNVKELSTYTLYRKIIPVLQGSDYALSDTFRGYIRLYDASGANLSVVSVTDNNPLLGGENYGILTIPEDVSYITLNFMNSGNVDYSTFEVALGTQGRRTTLNDDIKVSYNQLIDVPDNGISDSDIDEIVQRVIGKLCNPVLGRVDDENNIILTGDLTDGTYTFKYEDDEGNTVAIGTYTVGETNGDVNYFATSGDVKYTSDNVIYLDTASEHAAYVYCNASNKGVYTDSSLTAISDTAIPIAVPSDVTKVKVAFPNLASDAPLIRLNVIGATYDENSASYVKTSISGWSEYGTLEQNIPSGAEYIIIQFTFEGYSQPALYDLTDVEVAWE